jgi:hypothetical protein
MKLSIALGAACLILTGSLVAHATLTHQREQRAVEARSRALALAEARLTPAQRSERDALAGLDGRLEARLHRFASR